MYCCSWVYVSVCITSEDHGIGLLGPKSQGSADTNNSDLEAVRALKCVTIGPLYTCIVSRCTVAAGYTY